MDTLPVDPGAAGVRAVLADCLPDHPVTEVTWLGEGGENVTYLVDGDLVLRFGKEPDPVRRADLVVRDERLFTEVAAVSPVPVPMPVLAAPAYGCLGYRRLTGEPLLDQPAGYRRAHGPSIAAALGSLLATLHAIATERLAGLVEVDDQPLAAWRDEAAQFFAATVGEIPATHHRAVRQFLAQPPPAGRYPLVFSHNDLGIEHVLVEPSVTGPGVDGTSPVRVTGVIDWSDAAFVDPALDVGRLYRDLGPAALDAALDGYGRRSGAGVDLPALRERAVFYARATVFEDVAYGLDTGKTWYAEKSLAALRWLFPAG